MANQDYGGEPVPAWAQTLIGQNKKLERELVQLKAGKTTNQRRELLEQKLKDAPEAVRRITLRNFDRMKFDNDEEFNDYLEDEIAEWSGSPEEKKTSDEIAEWAGKADGKEKPKRTGNEKGSQEFLEITSEDIDTWANSKPKSQPANNS